MADNSELDKMRLAAMMNKSPATGGLKATNTVTPSFGMSTPIEQAYSRWKQDSSIAAKLLRGEQMSGEDIAKDLYYQLDEATKHPENFMGTIKAVGNLNLVPRIAKETLKGPETQTLQSFMNQVKQMPGVTKEGLNTNAPALQHIKPDTPMTKAQFEAYIAPSKYQKVDLKTDSANIREHFRDEVENEIDESDVFSKLGIPETMHNDIADLMYGGEITDLPKPMQTKLKKLGFYDMEILEDAFMMQKEEMIDDGIDYMLDMEGLDPGELIKGTPEYKHRTFQRIVETPYTSPVKHDYFEIGVTHPAQENIPYRHYNDPDIPKGLVGHVRGSILNEDASGISPGIIFPKKSMIIEEIQSDAQQRAKQLGPLNQVHGTLFKAGVQHGLENGVNTIYLPTANTIKFARGFTSDSAPHLNIYDTDIIKEGLNPLLQIPGTKHSVVTGANQTIAPDATRPLDVRYARAAQQDAHEYAMQKIGIDPQSSLSNAIYNEIVSPLQRGVGTTDAHLRDVVTKHANPAEYDKLKNKYGENTYVNFLDNDEVEKVKSIDADAFSTDLFRHRYTFAKDNPTSEQLTDTTQNALPLYHKIEFSPEAIEHILKGPGQTAPGYKQGGTIHQDKMNYAVHMAGGGQPNNKFSYASGLADLAGLDEEYYNANTIPLQHYDKSTEHNGPADAMRHMLFQAQITKNHNPTLAKIISQGHERLLDWGQPDAEQAMDFHNDAIGREIGAKAKSIDEMTQMAKDAITSGRAKVIGHDLPGKYYKLGGNVKNVSTNTGKHGNIALTTAQMRVNLLRKKHG